MHIILEEARRELLVIIVAALPFLELRGAIPLGLGMGIGPWRVFFLAVAGNLLPIFPLVWLIHPVHVWLKSRGRANLVDRLLARTRLKGGAVDKYGALGLLLFVAIPLPGTGAWSGALAAFLFGVPKRWALPALSAGTVCAGLIMTFLGETVKWLFF